MADAAAEDEGGEENEEEVFHGSPLVFSVFMVGCVSCIQSMSATVWKTVGLKALANRTAF